jgi:signal transduction histidine kinase
MKKPESTKEAYFKVDSRLLLQLGEQLVSNPAIALAELVKNAYDADATEVSVTLKNVQEKTGGTITIKDNGLGISSERFTQTWMRIATTDSNDNPVSKFFKRKRAGEKGIGRIACKNLAKELAIISISENDSGEKIELSANFNWDLFLPGSELDKVPISYSVKKVESSKPTGTELILKSTTNKWTIKNIERLNLELTDLFSPVIFKKEFKGQFASKQDPGFSYKVKADEFDLADYSISESFLKSAWAVVTGSVDSSGKAQYELKILNPIINKFQKKYEREGNFEFLQNLHTEIYFFKYAKEYFKNSTWKFQQAQKIGRDRGGIKVYADVFKVYGFGDPEDDWLRLSDDKSRAIGSFIEDRVKVPSIDRRPALQLFDNRGLFGYVQFDKKSNEKLSISINRESFTKNQAYEELVHFVRTGVNFATVVYSDERLKKANIEKAEEEKRERNEREVAEKAQQEAEEERKKAEEEEKEAKLKKEEAERSAKKKEQERLEAEEIRSHIESEFDTLWDRIIELEERKKSLTPHNLEELKELRSQFQQIRSNLYKAKEKEKKLQDEVHLETAKATQTAWLELSAKVNSFAKYKEAATKGIEIKESEVEKQKEKYNEELSILRVLASTGTLIFIFSHEISSFISDVRELKKSFSSAIKKSDEKEKKKYQTALSLFDNKVEMVHELRNFIDITGGRQSRSELSQFFIKSIVDDISKPFTYETKRRGIEIINEVPPYIRTPIMYRSEIVAILINLFTNSVKFVTNTDERKIKFEAYEDKNDIIVIRCLDTGRGLIEEKWEEVFDPFVSYAELDIYFGAGTGLGLKIVRDILLGYGGEVKFVHPPSEWKTCIEIRLPLMGQ